jgi:hypothetical protein
VLDRLEHGVVGAGDVAFGADFHPLISPQDRRALSIEFGALFVGKLRFVRVLGGRCSGV